MTSIFQKNSIIAGSIDNYCLVCHCYLRSEKGVYNHIQKLVHKKNLVAYPYLETYRDEYIKKVKNGYFCEFCNTLFPTRAKVGLHIGDATHTNNKGYQLLKRVGDFVVANNSVYISEGAWNGLIEQICAICDIEFYNDSIHKTEQGHLINLIQKKVEFGVGRSIYRKIDDTSFQCLTCNMIYAISTLDTHFDDEDHIKLYSKSCETTIRVISGDTTNNKEMGSENDAKDDINHPKEISSEKQSEKTVIDDESAFMTNSTTNDLNRESVSITHKAKASKQFEKEKILDSVHDFQKNGFNINFETESAFCKTCFVSVAFNFDIINNHIDEHKNPNNCIYKPEPLLNKKCTKTVLSDSNNHKNESKRHDVVEQLGLNNTNVQISNTNTKNDKPFDEINFIARITASKTQAIRAVVSHVTKTKSKPVETKISSKDHTESEVSTTVILDDVMIFAKDNHFTYNKGNTNAFCRACKTRVPSSLKCMQEHAAGATHKRQVSIYTNEHQELLPSTSTQSMMCEVQPMINFITTVTALDREVLVNDKYCLSSFSFDLITKHVHKLRCQICEENLRPYEVKVHVNSPPHEELIHQVPLVCNMETEFIREPRPDLYHCGFCNLIMGGWDDLTNHLNCDDHLRIKSMYERRLRQVLPHIYKYRLENPGKLQLILK